jgi:hypothetical protein
MPTKKDTLYTDLSFSDSSVENEIVIINRIVIANMTQSGGYVNLQLSLPKHIKPEMYLLKVSNHLRTGVEKLMKN